MIKILCFFFFPLFYGGSIESSWKLFVFQHASRCANWEGEESSIISDVKEHGVTSRRSSSWYSRHGQVTEMDTARHGHTQEHRGQVYQFQCQTRWKLKIRFSKNIKACSLKQGFSNYDPWPAIIFIIFLCTSFWGISFSWCITTSLNGIFVRNLTPYRAF